MQKVTFLTWREQGRGRRELRAAEPPAVGPGAPNCISSPCPLPPPCIRPSAPRLLHTATWPTQLCASSLPSNLHLKGSTAGTTDVSVQVLYRKR